MSKLYWILFVACAVMASSCNLGNEEYNDTESHLKDYASTLIYVSAEIPVLWMSKQIDIDKTPIFELGKEWHWKTKSNGYAFYDIEALNITANCVADTTWNVSVSTLPENSLSNLNASMKVSFSTVSSGYRIWTIDISGSTEETTGYSSSFRTLEAFKLDVKWSPFKDMYTVTPFGTVRTEFFSDGINIESFTTIYGDGDSYDFLYER